MSHYPPPGAPGSRTPTCRRGRDDGAPYTASDTVAAAETRLLNLVIQTPHPVPFSTLQDVTGLSSRQLGIYVETLVERGILEFSPTPGDGAVAVKRKD